MHRIRPAPRPLALLYLPLIPPHPPRGPDLPRLPLPLPLRILRRTTSSSKPASREPGRALRLRYKVIRFGHKKDVVHLRGGVGE